jgi:hypothetical protein
VPGVHMPDGGRVGVCVCRLLDRGAGGDSVLTAKPSSAVRLITWRTVLPRNYLCGLGRGGNPHPENTVAPGCGEPASIDYPRKAQVDECVAD